MSVSVWVGEQRFEIGDSAFLKAFFSTVFVRLENEDWGRLYPTIMRDLYGGRLSHLQADVAARELDSIRERLAAFSPGQVVWDFEHLEAKPPWGTQISPHISSLSNYFVTSDGKDLLDVLARAFSEAARIGEDATVG